MTNDTTTLNGALAELGETLASNINNKGVTASANDGLTTLANKVSNIPCYDKKIYTLGNFTYNSSYLKTEVVDDSFWNFTALKTASGANAMIVLNGIDFTPVSSNAVVSLSFTIARMNTTVGQFSMGLTANGTSILNSIYYNKNNYSWYGTAKTGTTDNPQQLNVGDVVKYVADIKNREVRVYANDTLLATRVMSNTIISGGQLKMVFYLGGTNYSNAIKDIEYNIEK